MGLASRGNERPENNSIARNQRAPAQPGTTPCSFSSGTRVACRHRATALGGAGSALAPAFGNLKMYPPISRGEKVSQSLLGPRLSSLTTVTRTALALCGRTALSSPSPSVEYPHSEPTLFEFEPCQEGRGSKVTRLPSEVSLCPPPGSPLTQATHKLQVPNFTWPVLSRSYDHRERCRRPNYTRTLDLES